MAIDTSKYDKSLADEQRRYHGWMEKEQEAAKRHEIIQRMKEIRERTKRGLSPLTPWDDDLPELKDMTGSLTEAADHRHIVTESIPPYITTSPFADNDGTIMTWGGSTWPATYSKYAKYAKLLGITTDDYVKQDYKEGNVEVPIGFKEEITDMIEDRAYEDKAFKPGFVLKFSQATLKITKVDRKNKRCWAEHIKTFKVTNEQFFDMLKRNESAH